MNPQAVRQYFAAHPALAPWLDQARPLQRLRRALVRGDLPAAVRLPRRLRGARGHSGSSARARTPPPAPRATCAGCPVGPRGGLPLTPGRRRRRGPALLARQAVPVAHRPGSGTSGAISAEKGYLREAGNLLFHLALLGLLVAIAIGELFGYKVGHRSSSVASSATADRATTTSGPGRLVDGADLAPF